MLRSASDSGRQAKFHDIGLPSKPTGEYEDFLVGFVFDDRKGWARPVSVAVADDGSLPVSLPVTEDGNETIWRVAYAPDERSGEGGQPPSP